MYTQEMYAEMAAADYATGTNQVVTIAYAAPGRKKRHVISGLAWSFDAAVVASTLTITDGGITIFEVDLIEGGYHSVQFDPPKCGSRNAAVQISLDATGAGLIGKLNVLGHWIDT